MDYADYLHLDALLALQRPRSSPEEHDELLFVVVHQAYELWFKLLLHELGLARAELTGGDLYRAIATFKRCRTVMKLLVAQIDVVETLTPRSFSSFRDRLDTASGFQSAQFREIEFLLGYKRADLLRYHPAGSPAHERLARRLAEPSINDALYRFLARHGAAVPERLLARDPTLPAAGDEELQEGLLTLYVTRPDLEILFELMADFDEGLQEWRYRHVKLVERTIGSKHGTGGSLGVEFLKRSLFVSAFPDLWAIRHRM